VHFDFHNLKTEFVPQQRNDFILLRNVMMYFDEAEQKRLVEKFLSLPETQAATCSSDTPKAFSV